MHTERLPELSKTLEASGGAGGSLDHRDLISRLILERLFILSSPPSPSPAGEAMEAQPSSGNGGGGGGGEEMLDESLDERVGPGGSGPPSLGSLNLSFPHQMSLSASATSSSKAQ